MFLAIAPLSGPRSCCFCTLHKEWGGLCGPRTFTWSCARNWCYGGHLDLALDTFDARWCERGPAWARKLRKTIRRSTTGDDTRLETQEKTCCPGCPAVGRNIPKVKLLEWDQNDQTFGTKNHKKEMGCYATSGFTRTCTHTWCYATHVVTCTCVKYTWYPATDVFTCTCIHTWCYATDMRWHDHATCKYNGFVAVTVKNNRDTQNAKKKINTCVLLQRNTNTFKFGHPKKQSFVKQTEDGTEAKTRFSQKHNGIAKERNTQTIKNATACGLCTWRKHQHWIFLKRRAETRALRMFLLRWLRTSQRLQLFGSLSNFSRFEFLDNGDGQITCLGFTRWDEYLKPCVVGWISVCFVWNHLPYIFCCKTWGSTASSSHEPVQSWFAMPSKKRWKQQVPNQYGNGLVQFLSEVVLQPLPSCMAPSVVVMGFPANLWFKVSGVHRRCTTSTW